VRQHVRSGSPHEVTIGFSRAVRVERQVFVSATAAIWPDGHVDPDAGAQARRSLAIIEEALRESGATLRDVVRTRVFLVDAAHGAAVGEAHAEAFGEIELMSRVTSSRTACFLSGFWQRQHHADGAKGRQLIRSAHRKRVYLIDELRLIRRCEELAYVRLAA
jgi:enamine deaminase RidA (YjgF/YER057c/UK114 family)